MGPLVQILVSLIIMRAEAEPTTLYYFYSRPHGIYDNAGHSELSQGLSLNLSLDVRGIDLGKSSEGLNSFGNQFTTCFKAMFWYGKPQCLFDIANIQVWSLTQFYHVDFLQSRIGVKSVFLH